jgi:hypothetical protein
MNKNPRSNGFPVTLLTVMTLTLCGGCAAIGGGELETFVREMLLSAAAAFLL